MASAARKPANSDNVWQRKCDSSYRARHHSAGEQCRAFVPSTIHTTEPGRDVREQIKIALLTKQVADLTAQVEALRSVIDVDELMTEYAAKQKLKTATPDAATLRLWAAQSAVPAVASEPEVEGAW